MASAGSPIPKVANAAAIVVVFFFFFLLLILNKGMPAEAGVTKCSDYCRAKCYLGCEDDSDSACTTGNILCKDYPETCYSNCKALAIGACFGPCYSRCTDDCI